MKPIRLLPRPVERVWGTTDLGPWFPNSESEIGEMWFTADDNATSDGLTLRALMERDGAKLLGTAVQPAFGGRFPILVKFLLTREKLSIQVHPDDIYAEENEGSPGKTEMWYVLRADTGATIAAGFIDTARPEQVRQALSEKKVESLLKWWPAAAGETYFVPARTVHAVGAGLAICEIQQNSDVTYRLWDYDRRRELQVESSLAVAEFGRHPGPAAPIPIDGGELLATCPYFATERMELNGRVEWRSDPQRFHLLVATRGGGVLKADGGEWQLRQGECWLIPACCGIYTIDGVDLEILRVYVPA